MNKVNELNKVKHIVVTEDRYRKIKAKGRFLESFDDVIQRMLKEGKTQKEIFED